MRRIWGFFGFMLSVWLFGGGRNANAGFMVRAKDLSEAGRHNAIQSFDAHRFARTGEMAKEQRRANRFAYACISYFSEGNVLTDSASSTNCPMQTFYVETC
jgi:hypothetical protein